MKVCLTNNLGDRLVRELSLDKRCSYKCGDSVEVSESAGNALVKRGLASIVEIKAVPKEPVISKSKKSTIDE